MRTQRLVGTEPAGRAGCLTIAACLLRRRNGHHGLLRGQAQAAAAARARACRCLLLQPPILLVAERGGGGAVAGDAQARRRAHRQRRPAVAGLADQVVERLLLVPALVRRHLWQEGGGAALPALRVCKLNDKAWRQGCGSGRRAG